MVTSRMIAIVGTDCNGDSRYLSIVSIHCIASRFWRVVAASWCSWNPNFFHCSVLVTLGEPFACRSGLRRIQFVSRAPSASGPPGMTRCSGQTSFAIKKTTTRRP